MTGSAAGAIARLWLVNITQQRINHVFPGSTFPWGTLTVNVSGALLIGILAGSAAPWLTEEQFLSWHLAIVGMLGSYTTVSSFSVQTLSLWQSGQLRNALWNVIASLVLCVIAAMLGALIGSILHTWLTP